MHVHIQRRKNCWDCSTLGGSIIVFKHMTQALDFAWQRILTSGSDTFYIRTAPTRHPDQLYIQDVDPLDSPYLFQSTSKREAYNDLLITLQMLNEVPS